MTTKMLINAVDAEEFRIAFVKDGFLDGFHIETSTSEQKRGNIYRGVVEKVVDTGPDQARAAISAGATAVVVGSAITRPEHITEWFARAVAGERTRAA